jgi:hypothetical protein
MGRPRKIRAEEGSPQSIVSGGHVDEAPRLAESQARAQDIVSARNAADAARREEGEKVKADIGKIVKYTERNGSVVSAITCGAIECRLREDGSVEGIGATGANYLSAWKTDEFGRILKVWRPVAWVFSMEASTPYKVTL